MFSNFGGLLVAAIVLVLVLAAMLAVSLAIGTVYIAGCLQIAHYLGWLWW